VRRAIKTQENTLRIGGKFGEMRVDGALHRVQAFHLERADYRRGILK
jgi:hypothetical protein